jgi:hypothetical protein
MVELIRSGHPFFAEWIQEPADCGRTAIGGTKHKPVGRLPHTWLMPEDTSLARVDARRDTVFESTNLIIRDRANGTDSATG